MQGVDSNITEANHVSRVYSRAAVLYLQFVLHVISFRLRNMFYTLALVYDYDYYYYYVQLNLDTCTIFQSVDR